MARFYLLPPRTLLRERFAQWLLAVLPGFDRPGSLAGDLVELLEGAMARHEDVYLLFADELPGDGSLHRALAEDFGAEPGDEIIDLRRNNDSDQPAAPVCRQSEAA